MTEVYKVCRVANDGTLRSGVAHGTEANQYGMDLEYPLNEEVHAAEGTVGIFCFPCPDDALLFTLSTFSNDWGATRVLVRCTTTHTPERLKYVLAPWSARWWRKYAKLLLRRRYHGNVVGEPYVYAAPPGTCIVPSLTPLEVMT